MEDKKECKVINLQEWIKTKEEKERIEKIVKEILFNSKPVA